MLIKNNEKINPERFDLTHEGSVHVTKNCTTTSQSLNSHELTDSTPYKHGAVNNKVFVEFNSTFFTCDKKNADELLDKIYDAVTLIICPEDESRRITCYHCEGTLVNPLDEVSVDTTYLLANDPYTPGEPCVECVPSDTNPYAKIGTYMPCLREHGESSKINVKGTFETMADTQLLQVYNVLLEKMKTQNIQKIRQYINEQKEILQESIS